MEESWPDFRIDAGAAVLHGNLQAGGDVAGRDADPSFGGRVIFQGLDGIEAQVEDDLFRGGAISVGAIWGGVVAAPAFAKIAQFDLQYLEVPPDAAPARLLAASR